MNFLRKLFGLSENDPSPVSPAPKAQPDEVALPEVSKLPDSVGVYDAYGRERLISREEWRRDHRADALKAAWNDAGRLYPIIASELAAGFAADMLEPARRFAEITPDKASGAVLLGVTLFELNRLDEAAAIFETCLRENGDHALVLVNYAKVVQRRGDHTSIDDLSWRALQADPNFEPALVFAARNTQEREGAPGVASLLRRVAVLPGSWLAQLWLARLALDDQDLGSAKALYKLALSKVPPPPPPALLVQMSGDLGSRGHLAELLELVLPRFDPVVHGLMVGSNLLRALLETERLDEAHSVLEALYRLQVPDWKTALDQWQKEIDDRSLAASESSQVGELELLRAPLEGPVWAMEAEGFNRLLPAKDPSALRIGILAPSFTFASLGDTADVIAEREGREGVFGRSLALYLAEQIHLGTTARGIAIFLRVRGKGGFVLASAPYEREQALNLAGAGDQACDLIVNPHVDATLPLWRLTLQVVSVASKEVVGEFEGACMAGNPERTFRSLAASLNELAVGRTGVAALTPPAWVGPLTAAAFVPQMQARTQTLDVAVAAFARDEHGPAALGERPLFDALLFQAVDQPAEPVPRLLLLTALARHRSTGSPLYLEYEERVRRLVVEFPQSNPAASVVLAAVNALYPPRT